MFKVIVYNTIPETHVFEHEQDQIDFYNLVTVIFKQHAEMVDPE